MLPGAYSPAAQYSRSCGSPTSGRDVQDPGEADAGMLISEEIVKGREGLPELRYDQKCAAPAGSDECVQISVALPSSEWIT